MRTIEESIWQHSILSPDKVAVKSGKQSITYKELTECILAASNYLKSFSCYQKGCSIIISAGKQLGFLYAYFGAHLAGLKIVPVDSEINKERFDFIVNQINPIFVIGFDKLETRITKISLKDFDSIKGIISNNFKEFPLEEDIADILFTTGTTGLPKGVPLTFKNEAAAARNINIFIKNKKEDIELLALPISHSFGLGRLRCCLSNGQTLVLLGRFVNVKRIFRIIEEERVTGFTMVPASWKFLQKMSGDELSKFANQLNYIEMGSAYFSAEDKKYLANLFPKTRICMHYGLTEASRSVFMEFHVDKLESVGKASPFTDVQIFDELGNMLPLNTEGEICIKGEHVMKDYLNIAYEKIRWGDYFRTGDWGTIDSDGYVYLKSRKKELINVGGKKVAPTEVESILLKMDFVLDCACVGTPDPEGILGEVVKAFIVKDPNSQLSELDIQSALIGKIETYKIPALFSWVDSIPKTQNGKIRRNLLK